MPVDGQAHRGEDGRAEVEDEHRLPRTQAEIEQAVMQVFGIRRGNRFATPPPAHDRPGGIDNRDGEGDHRHDQGQHHGALRDREHGKGGQAEP